MQCKQKKRTSKFVPPQKQIPTQELFYKITQSFVSYLGLPLFLHLIATALKFLYLIATLSSLLIASACNLTVIRYCLMSVAAVSVERAFSFVCSCMSCRY